MQRVNKGRWLWVWWPEDTRLYLRLLILSVSLTAGWLVPANAAEPPGGTVTADTAPGSTGNQEQFLQHFISRSLGQKISAEREVAPAAPTPASALPQAGIGTRATEAPATALGGTSTPLGSTVMTMVFSLGAILGCLLLVAYLTRRYFFPQLPFGKRVAPLRVLARAHLTPKAMVALLEVPGKTLVIGVAGNSMVTLGEAVMDVPANPASPMNTPQETRPSFAVTLDESTQELHEATPEEETFLQVSERIQRKVSRLKQL